MSAQPRPARTLAPMGVAELDAVLAIEDRAYPFPWSRGNFLDSLAAGYPAQLLYGPRHELLGYFVALAGVDEMHLLNLTVTPTEQGQGHGRFLLDALVAQARARQARQLWLEVRAGNERAQRLYARYGFRQVGVRRGYYPAEGRCREDALVMSLDLGEVPHAMD